MKYVRRTAGRSTWTDHKTNADIAKEINITPVLDKIQYYKSKWIKQTTQTDKNITLHRAEGREEERRTDLSVCMRQKRVNKWVQLLDCYVMTMTTMMIMMMMMIIMTTTTCTYLLLENCAHNSISKSPVTSPYTKYIFQI